MMYTFYILMTKLVQMFPDSPFSDLVSGIEPIKELGYISYFLPVKEIVAVTVTWAGIVVAAKALMFLYRFLYNKVVNS